MTETDRLEETETLLRRLDILARLCRSPAYIRDLVAETDQSRSTINRAVNELESIDLVERGDDGIQATTAGRLARDRLEAFLAELDDVRAAEGVLEPLSAEVDVDAEFVAGSEPVIGTDPTPYRPAERIHDELADAKRYRALVPTIEDPRHVRLLYEHVVAHGREAELVVSDDVFETLRQEFPRRMAVMSQEERFTLLVGDVPPFGLVLLEHERGVANGTVTTAHMVVFDEYRGVHGVLSNDADRAVRWAETRYRAARAGATDCTDMLSPDPDGGSLVSGPRDGALPGQSLPAPLEREGFVRVDAAYFREEPVADPPTAWRAGLSLAEVHTGYAVPRVHPDDDETDDDKADDGGTDDDETVTATLATELEAGTDCLVVGPPGSGKSTVCKQVACEWYEAGRGPVLYRESERGRAFASVEELVATVDAADGHALVVVEDAVRPATDAVFDALERVGDRDDVSVLLDAREGEWREYSPSSDATALEVVHVPPLREADCRRLLDHFERTTGRPADVPVERLWSAVRDRTIAGDGANNEMLRAIHRLATYADPLADEPTALEEAIAAVYDDADDDRTLGVVILANALNAAGLGVDRARLFALAVDADGERPDCDAFDAVDAAIGRLEGEVLFPREDGGYRTVHEEWSTTFLAHLVAVEGEEAAARRFGAAVSALLSLADEPRRCERVGRHLDDEWALAPVVDEPGRWADEVAEAVYAMGRERPKLAPLYGDGAHDSITLPAACSAAFTAERPGVLGWMFLAGGYYDRAERAFERLSSEEPECDADRLFGLARIAHARGEYDRAREYCQRSLERIRSVEDRRGEARALDYLGEIARKQGEYDRAHEYCQRGLELARQCGARRTEADALKHLGNVASDRGDHDRAADLFGRSLELEEELGNRSGVASKLINVGHIERLQGNYDRAAEAYERSLAISEELGDRPGVSGVLNNLGTLHGIRGDYDRAVEAYERSLAISEELGNRQTMAHLLNNLGQVESRRGSLESAAERYERSRELKEELGDRSGMLSTLNNLATVATRLEAYDRAREYARRSRELAADVDNPEELARSHRCLGEVAMREGDLDRARDRLETARDVVEGGVTVELRIRLTCGELELAAGDVDRARSHAEYVHEECETLDATYWVGRSAQLLGRVELAAGDVDAARDRLQDALATFEGIGALHDALETLRLLVDHASGPEEFERRARDLAADAPREVADRHREWIPDPSS